MKNFLLLLIFYPLIILTCKAHDESQIDSLKNLLKSVKQDTQKVNIFNNLASAYLKKDEEKAMDCSNNALHLSEQIIFEKGIAKAYYNISYINYYKGEYLTAIKFIKKALKTFQKIDSQRGIANSYNSLGTFYYDLGNYSESLKNYLACLKTERILGTKKGIGTAYYNVGNVYGMTGNTKKAFDYYFISLKLFALEKDEPKIAYAFNNIGFMYLKTNKNAKALKYVSAALSVRLKLKSKPELATAYSALAGIYSAIGDSAKEILYMTIALRLRQEVGDSRSTVVSFLDFGNYYLRHKNFTNASLHLKRALSIAKEIRYSQILIPLYGSLTELDSATANWKGAYENKKLYTTYRDSVFNEENTKRLTRIEMQYEFENKEAKEIAAEKVKEQELEHSEQMQYLGIFCIIIFVFSFLFLLSRLNISIKTIDFIGFVGVLLFFQFLEALMHPYITNYTHGNPMLFMGINIALASMIKPLHHLLENRLIEYSHHTAEKSKFYHFQKEKHAKILLRQEQKKNETQNDFLGKDSFDDSGDENHE